MRSAQCGRHSAQAMYSLAVIAVIAGIVSSLAAFIGLAISARAMAQQARVFDAASYFDAADRVAEAQRRIYVATTQEQRKFETNELFNVLEAIAYLELYRRYERSTRKMVRLLLIAAFAIVETSPEAKAQFVEATSSPDTFYALKRFQRKYRDAINAQAQDVAKHHDPLLDLVGRLTKPQT